MDGRYLGSGAGKAVAGDSRLTQDCAILTNVGDDAKAQAQGSGARETGPAGGHGWELFRALSPRPSAQLPYDWARVDAMIDAIYAIAATLLVLNLQVPNAAPGRLGGALAHHWPEYVAYGLGFLQILAGWSVLRRVSDWCASIDHIGTLLVLLAQAAFVLTPFTISVLASTIRQPANLVVAVRLMTGVLAVSITLYSLAIAHIQRQQYPRRDLDPDAWHLVRILSYTAPAWPLTAFALAYVSAYASLGIVVAFLLLMLWPIDARARSHTAYSATDAPE